MSKIRPQPRKLTLRQSLNATSKPIERLGDLVCVQHFQQMENRSIYMPSRDVTVKEFRQPDIQTSVRLLYERGGWLESLAKFSGEALALHYCYLGGFATKSGLACDAGDPAQFERDYTEALAQLPNLTREAAEIAWKTVLLMHRKYKLSAALGEQRSVQLARFSMNRIKDEQAKHEQWRKWQAARQAEKPTFAALSKHQQAVILKGQHSITETVGAIAKRLEPLPPSKHK